LAGIFDIPRRVTFYDVVITFWRTREYDVQNGDVPGLNPFATPARRYGGQLRAGNLTRQVHRERKSLVWCSENAEDDAERAVTQPTSIYRRP
jgi:hypothetical protein